jgi:hypothetical protein
MGFGVEQMPCTSKTKIVKPIVHMLTPATKIHFIVGGFVAELFFY